MSLVFLLGGHDLEMLLIRELLEAHGQPFRDKKLAWGARATDYREDIIAIAAAGDIPVLVELAEDIPLPPKSIVIDHHGERAGADKSGSLRQVFDLLHLPESAWTRRRLLVAANDTGHIPAMMALGATNQEMADIRREDRSAQGATDDEETAARVALAGLTTTCQGALTIVELPHARASIVADLIEPAFGGPGARNLLVLMPHEMVFYGEGRLVNRLSDFLPGGWMGGALPARGFWGIDRRVSAIAEQIETWIGEDRQ